MVTHIFPPNRWRHQYILLRRHYVFFPLHMQINLLLSTYLPLKICKFQHVDGYKKTCQPAADWTRKIKSIWFFGGRQVTPLLSCNILSNNKLFILPLCISKEYYTRLVRRIAKNIQKYADVLCENPCTKDPVY